MTDERLREGSTLDRRRLLVGLSAAATMGLAGCGGQPGDGDGDAGGGGGGGGGGDGGGGGGDGAGGGETELGERVQKLTLDFFADINPYEAYAELMLEDLSNRLDLNIDAQPRDSTALVFGLYEDERTSLLPLYGFAPDLSPHFNTRRMSAHQAGTGVGAAAGQNTSQWANCDFSVRANEQGEAIDVEERRRLIAEAWSIASHDLAQIQAAPDVEIFGFRTDQVDPDTDAFNQNPAFAPHTTEDFLHVSPVGDNDTIRLASESSGVGELTNPYLFISVSHWRNGLINSGLKRVTADYQVEKNLAGSIEFEDGGSTVVVEVKDGATFHDGQPVTAADVKFTYDYMIAGARAGQHTFAPALPFLEEIAEVDDRTVAFHMERPFAPLTEREMYTWGIMHKDTWMDALSGFGIDSWESHEEEFDNYGELEIEPDDMNGSGPWQMGDLVVQQSITFLPWDGHVTYDEPEMTIEFLDYADAASRFAALQAGEVNATRILAQQADRIADRPNFTVHAGNELNVNQFLAPNWAAPPTKFLEFRQAVAAVLNRQAIVDIVSLGRAEPEMYAGLLSTANPWRPPEDMLYRMAKDPEGNPDMARAFLEEAGWGWDDNGNLRYPADADLSERWAKGEAPDPDDYPCISPEGYVRPEGYELREDQVPGYNREPTDPWPEGFGT